MTENGGSEAFSIGAFVPKKSDGPIEKWFDISESTRIRGFEVRVRHISKRTIERWSRECTRMVFNPDTNRKEPKINNKALFSLYAEHVIPEWRGLTVGGVRKILVLNAGSSQVPDSTLVAPTKENIINLLENASNSFDVLITDLARDPRNFIAGGPKETPEEEMEEDEEEGAVGNSSSTPSGS